MAYDGESIDPVAQEEKRIFAIVERIKHLEKQLEEKEHLVRRLRELINKAHKENISTLQT